MQSSFRQFTHVSCRVTFFYSMRWCYVEQSTHAVNFIFSKAYEQTLVRIYFSEYLCLFSKVLINCKIAVGHWKRIYYLKPWKLENTPSKRGNVVTTCAPAHSNQTVSMRNVDKVSGLWKCLNAWKQDNAIEHPFDWNFSLTIVSNTGWFLAAKRFQRANASYSKHLIRSVKSYVPTQIEKLPMKMLSLKKTTKNRTLFIFTKEYSVSL